MGLVIERIGGVLGAEVRNFDAGKEYPESIYEQMRRALARYCVLVIRGQPLTDLEAVAFVDRFGESFEQWNITPHFLSPATTKVYRLSSRAGGSRYAGSTWHADYAFSKEPADLTCMQMRCGGGRRP